MKKLSPRPERAKSIARWENEGGAGKSPPKEDRDAGGARDGTPETRFTSVGSYARPRTALVGREPIVAFTSAPNNTAAAKR